MVAAIVLAAGESKRMNSPKALLPIQGENFAECIAGKIRACGIDAVYLVAGAHYETIKSAFDENRKPFEILLNARHQEGQLLSLQEGLRHLPAGARAALVWPVDQPLVKEETALMLINAFNRERATITIPMHAGRRGHPVIYEAKAIKTLLSFGGRQTAKDLQSIYAAETCIVEVGDPAVLIDIDTPEDYSKYITGADF
ncbi:MAG TPA: nucleotidyltransferase family protein [Acidobacteriota bacterium]|nr:nucleotidyltransferase family protein [Acidobacteriota bacterium]